MLRIRLSMGGVRKRPIYKIVVADGRYPRDGKFIEKIGSYNPLLPKDKKERIKVEFERVKYWISKGAQPTLRVSRILGEMQLMPMPKPGNNPLKAIPKKDRKKEGKEEPKAEAKKEEPKKEELKAEAKKEEPKKEEPKAEAKKEEPKKEEPKAEAKKEEPKKEEPKAEAKKEEPKKEQPKAEAKKEEPKKEQPKAK